MKLTSVLMKYVLSAEKETMKNWEYRENTGKINKEKKQIPGNQPSFDAIYYRKCVERVIHVALPLMITDGSSSVTILWRQNESIFIVQENRAVWLSAITGRTLFWWGKQFGVHILIFDVIVLWWKTCIFLS